MLEASEAPPVNSLTLASKKGVSALPVIFLSLASLRALCIADSIKLPEAESSLGIGTAIKIPVPSLSFKFASAIKIGEKRKRVKEGEEGARMRKRKRERVKVREHDFRTNTESKGIMMKSDKFHFPISRAQSSGVSTRHGTLQPLASVKNAGNSFVL